jgi:hypothetical protein
VSCSNGEPCTAPTDRWTISLRTELTRQENFPDLTASVYAGCLDTSSHLLCASSFTRKSTQTVRVKRSGFERCNRSRRVEIDKESLYRRSKAESFDELVDVSTPFVPNTIVNDLSRKLSRVRTLPSPTSSLISANVRSVTALFPAKCVITARPLSTNGFPEKCKLWLSTRSRTSARRQLAKVQDELEELKVNWQMGLLKLISRCFQKLFKIVAISAMYNPTTPTLS